MRLLILFPIISMLIAVSGYSGSGNVNTSFPDNEKPDFLKVENQWVDSVMASLTTDERITQLFMIAAYSNKGDAHNEEISRLIKDYKIGGLIFMQGDPISQIKLTNAYQKASKTPLLIAMDAEWGPAMRLNQVDRYPYQMLLGAVSDNKLVYEFGHDVARQLKLMGVHVNFAPVIDINNNRNNPVIGVRSFGEQKKNVARKGFAYSSGMQDQHVMAVAKHFPGHGDTDKDSHKTLPAINHSWERLDSLELYPFKELINSGVGGIMVAHLFIPELDNTPNLASTLSRKVVNDLLLDELQFKGLVFTDALNMNGVAKYYEKGVVDVKALLAGNDVLLFSQDVGKALEEIKKAMTRGEISQEEIDRRCKKIIQAKYWAGATGEEIRDFDNVVNEINKNTELITRKLVASALTLAKNQDSIVPFKNIDKKRILSICISDGKSNQFEKTLNLYKEIDNISLPHNVPEERLKHVAGLAKEYDVVIVSLYSNDRSPSRNFGYSSAEYAFVDKLAENGNVVLASFANPYLLDKVKSIDKLKAVLVGYEDNEITQDLGAQLLFGGIAASGKLPVTACKELPAGTGFKTAAPIRLAYTIPQEMGVAEHYIESIDSVIMDAIQQQATPGCQVLLARKGKVFYHKAFGYHTFDNKEEVKLSDIYDMASVTKIAATMAALMKMYDQKKFDPEKTLGYYLPELKGSNKENIVIKDVLAHQAQLTPWIPFYLKTLKDTSIFNHLYSKVPTEKHTEKVCEGWYILPEYRDTILQLITDSKLEKTKKYLYSDCGFYYFQKIVENNFGIGEDSLVETVFYDPIGASTLGYQPSEKFGLQRIVPSAVDKEFRKTKIHGYVHDQGAAMMGGVAGHAGLFGNANDLAKMMQMYLNGGTYGGEKFIEPGTIELFTSCAFCDEGNRRGLGFDKPEMNYEKEGPTCQCVSAESYGHSGFTGILTWVDPKTEVVYVFVSNRTMPDDQNGKLLKTSARTKIMQLLFDAVTESDVARSENQN